MPMNMGMRSLTLAARSASAAAAWWEKRPRRSSSYMTFWVCGLVDVV